MACLASAEGSITARIHITAPDVMPFRSSIQPGATFLSIDQGSPSQGKGTANTDR